MRTSYETLSALLKYQLSSATATESAGKQQQYNVDLIKKTISLVVFKVAFDLADIENESLVKYYATQVIALIGNILQYQHS